MSGEVLHVAIACALTALVTGLIPRARGCARAPRRSWPPPRRTWRSESTSWRRSSKAHRWRPFSSRTRGSSSTPTRAARDLFFEGKDPKDGNFLGLLEKAPEALRRAVANEGDELFSIDDDEQIRQVYHLAKRHFEMDGEPVVLVVVNNLTRELHKQEADVWKRMIRIMAHELNNSLAPITNMVHSARILARGAAQEAKLGVVFDTVSERAEHLRSFLEGFAQFARLPAPRKVDVEWDRFLEGLGTMWPSLRIEGDVPATKAWFDPAQILSRCSSTCSRTRRRPAVPRGASCSSSVLPTRARRGSWCAIAARG